MTFGSSRRLARVGKAAGVAADLPLVDGAEVGLIQILYRVLQRHDVGAAGVVDAVEHGSQRGRLTGAGLAGHQDNPLVEGGEIQRGGRQAQGLQLGNRLTQQAQRQRGLTLLAKEMHTAAVSAPGSGEVEFSDLLHLPVGVPGQESRNFFTVPRRQGRGIHILQFAVQAVLRRQAADQMNIRSAVPFRPRDQFIYRDHVSFLLTSPRRFSPLR